MQTEIDRQNEIFALKVRLSELVERAGQWYAVNSELKSRVNELEGKVRHLEALNDWYRKELKLRRAGAQKGGKEDGTQIRFFGGEGEGTENPEEATETDTYRFERHGEEQK